jgi:hypothetical protein
MTFYDPARRLFLRRLTLTAGGAVLLAAGCGGGEQESAGSAAQSAAAKTAAQTPAGVRPCDDLTGLTPAQIQVRETFEYVEQAPEPDLACHLCEFWQEPAAGRYCGGCTLFAGPVSPDGSCNSFSQA